MWLQWGFDIVCNVQRMGNRRPYTVSLLRDVSHYVTDRPWLLHLRGTCMYHNKTCYSATLAFLVNLYMYDELILCHFSSIPQWHRLSVFVSIIQRHAMIYEYCSAQSHVSNIIATNLHAVTSPNHVYRWWRHTAPHVLLVTQHNLRDTVINNDDVTIQFLTSLTCPTHSSYEPLFPPPTIAIDSMRTYT